MPDRQTEGQRAPKFRAIYMESGGGRAKTSLEEDDDRIEGRAAKTLVLLFRGDDDDGVCVIPREIC